MKVGKAWHDQRYTGGIASDWTLNFQLPRWWWERVFNWLFKTEGKQGQ